MALASVTDLKTRFLSLAPSEHAELWQFVADKGQRIAREERPTGDVAEKWFARIALETDTAEKRFAHGVGLDLDCVVRQ